MLSWEQLQRHTKEISPQEDEKQLGVGSGEEIEPHLSRQISIESVRCSCMCVTCRVRVCALVWHVFAIKWSPGVRLFPHFD